MESKGPGYRIVPQRPMPQIRRRYRRIFQHRSSLLTPRLFKMRTPTGPGVYWVCQLLRTFINGFSKIAVPITDLTKKNRRREWTMQCQESFDRLKKQLCEATIVKTDARDYALGANLSQLCKDDRLQPVAYHSRKFKPTEINYDIHDKEMLAIVVGFKEREHMLKSCHQEVVVYTELFCDDGGPLQKTSQIGRIPRGVLIQSGLSTRSSESKGRCLVETSRR